MVYGTSPLKTKRPRRTKAQLANLDDELVRIVEENHPVTVRGAFYLAEVAGLVPKDEKGYDVVQRRLVALRISKAIPYGHITDGTRMVRRLIRWTGIGNFAEEAAQFYRRDYWANSPVNVEVWIEKDALSGVIFPTVVQEWGLELYVARGFSSVTYLQDAADNIVADGRPTYVYVLGDFDPSGQCAAETIARELPERAVGGEVHVEILAVNAAQVASMNIPTRGVKMSDSRAPKFVDQYGPISAELDAIPPKTLRSMVGRAIARHADRRAIDALKAIEAEERGMIVRLADGIAS